MFIIKCKDLINTAPAGFPTWMLSNRWEAFVLRYPTLEAALQTVQKQKCAASKRPQPERKYRIFKQNGRKLALLWED